MSKYELAVVLSAAIDDEARSATLDRVKDYVEKEEARLRYPEDERSLLLLHPVRS